MSARSFRRSHAKRLALERRRLSAAKRRALVAGATIGATAVFAANAEAANYTVTTPGDAGTGDCASTCTLRQAINTANDNGVAGTPDTVDFAPGLTGTITLTQGLITISDPGGLTIDGPGAGALSVSGGGTSGIFEISAASGSPAFAISGLTLTDGSSPAPGGAIADETSPLTLTDDTISGNTSDAPGGAVAAYYQLTVANSTISGNTADAGGGGIASFGGLSVTNSKIDGNTDSSPNAGGGILAFGGPLTLTGSQVTNNTTSGSGGGIAAQSTYGTTIENSTVSGNTASAGGGLHLTETPGETSSVQDPIAVENSTVSGNQASNGAGIDISSNQGNSPITIRASTVSGNHGGSSSFGGGILIGGELYNPFDLVDSTISGNTATDGAGVSLSYGGSRTQLVGKGGSISFDNSTIDGNAANANGGGIYLAAYSGTNPNGTAAINSTIVANDTANGAPDDLYQADVTSGGFNDTFSLIQNPGNAVLKSSQALITGVDAQLNPLANNGGPTQTMLPKDTSPVIDQGKAQSGLTTDQRGQSRTVDNGKTRPSGGDGTDIGAVELAKIVVPPPPSPKAPSISATVAPASGITDTRATLNGSISTNGQAVSWHFEYGRTTAYGKVTPTQSISAGHGQIPAVFNLTGLKRGTRYHYRVVAVSASGQTATSGDATFKTPAPTVKVKPGAVRAAHAVRLSGSAGACTRGSQVTLISSVFSPAHKFRGHNAVHARVGAGHMYSVVIRIPAGRKPGRYAITARCDGTSFGVTAFLRVLPPPPVLRFTA